ncbi:ABC transporter ATP-binding protein/permease [Pectinatus haikarae]|uniref:ATP-binding cassette transporter n=1 Tax=Pectinatus haikarae TaxID=349096 RepID=A0ABT9Y8H5_9FIRM|nr:ABC transporter ATP-binding protein/permease [Pectinatus haikarae]MDQ0203472.1 putative ATP-binding cassette transporter [Pectinatus haikarae]
MQIDSIKKSSRIFWLLFKDYWQSEEKWKARGLLATVVLFNLISIYLMLELTDWYNEFYTILQNYSYQAFWHSIGKFSILALLLIVLAVYAFYLQQMLQIKWRTWMTKQYIEKWMHKQTYYKLQTGQNNTDNPDQRIQEDINLFVSLTLSLGIGLFKQVMILISFIAMLWQLSGSFTVSFGEQAISIPGFMVWVTLLYSIIGTFITHKTGHQLISLNFNQQKYEADFRFSLVRLRENSECIAFYRGELPEKINFQKRFMFVIGNFKQIMNRQKILTGITVSYSQIAIILPILIAAPRYFNEMLPIGWLIQTLTAFGKVQDALSYLVSSYTDIAQWSSVIRRLSTFAEHMETADTLQADVNVNLDDELDISALTVRLPHGETIIKNLCMKLSAEKSMIITGASGSGKSTLLRTLAGIWPFAEGKITIPSQENILFLPQKPYLPLGTLRQSLYYPQAVPAIDTKNIDQLLKSCKLSKLADQLEEINDWSSILSLGEQQRLAFARIFLKKPAWVFLDEATSALDEATENHMYTLLKKELPQITIVSIGHRATLLPHHEYRLDVSGNGDYKFYVLNNA